MEEVGTEPGQATDEVEFPYLGKLPGVDARVRGLKPGANQAGDVGVESGQGIGVGGVVCCNQGEGDGGSAVEETAGVRVGEHGGAGHGGGPGVRRLPAALAVAGGGEVGQGDARGSGGQRLAPVGCWLLARWRSDRRQENHRVLPPCRACQVTAVWRARRRQTASPSRSMPRFRLWCMCNRDSITTSRSVSDGRVQW